MSDLQTASPPASTPKSSTTPTPDQPVGSGNYTAHEGDCLSSIALEHGFFWDSLWNLPENQTLKDKRKNPNALLPGDRLYVPKIRVREESCITGKKHRFQRKGEPTYLKFVMLTGAGTPRADVPYRVVLEAPLAVHNGLSDAPPPDAPKTIEKIGTSDASGMVELSLPGNTRRGTFYFDTRLEHPEEYELDLGCLDPADSITGLQARLHNLGFPCGDIDGKMSDLLHDALRGFQRAHGLPETGEPDAATCDKLRELHDQ